MPHRKVLTDKFIKGRRKTKAPKGARLDYWDALVPAMHLRITDTGAASFNLTARFPRNPKRQLGAAWERWTPSAWTRLAPRPGNGWCLIARGIDPRDEEERERALAEAARQAEAARRQVTLAVVAEAFIAEKLAIERKGGEVERGLRRDLLPYLGDKPITEISRGADTET